MIGTGKSMTACMCSAPSHPCAGTVIPWLLIADISPVVVRMYVDNSNVGFGSEADVRRMSVIGAQILAMGIYRRKFFVHGGMFY